MTEHLPQYAEPNFKDYLLFEVNSWIGRHFLKNKSKFRIKETPVLIDIGVGRHFTKGWIHVDFYRNHFRKFWKKRPKKLPDVETDLRYPLLCPSNVADGVYSGHTLEHLYPNHAYQLLSEIYRILKPSCWLRINVPDLKLCVEYYNRENNIFDFKFKAEAIANISQNYGHHSLWDVELLTYALTKQGFCNVRQVEFGTTGSDQRLIKEEEVRRFETLVIEAQKPI